MLPSDLTLSALRFILSAKSRQSCKQDCETVDFCNSLYTYKFQKQFPSWNFLVPTEELSSSKGGTF